MGRGHTSGNKHLSFPSKNKRKGRTGRRVTDTNDNEKDKVYPAKPLGLGRPVQPRPTGTFTVTREPWNNGRALSAGAEAVIFPSRETP